MNVAVLFIQNQITFRIKKEFGIDIFIVKEQMNESCQIKRMRLYLFI